MRFIFCSSGTNWNIYFYNNSDKGSFDTEVRSDLIDCVAFNDATAFRIASTEKVGVSSALGSAAYKVGNNQIVNMVKKMFWNENAKKGSQ